LNQTWAPGAPPPFGTAIAIGITGPGSGSGTLNILNGGTVDTGTANALAIGVSVAAIGSATGNGIANINDGTLRIGVGAGAGAPGAQGLAIGVDSGAVGVIHLGDGIGAAATAILDLDTSDAILTVGARLSSAAGGTGTLNILADGELRQGLGNITVGDDLGTGTLLVNGGRLVSTGGHVILSNGGTGQLNVLGGNISSTGALIAGNTAGVTGTATVSGGTSTFANAVFGQNGGKGILNLPGGGMIVGNPADFRGLYLGSKPDLSGVNPGSDPGAGSEGTVNVSGGELIVNGWVEVGRGQGKGTINVSGSGVLNSTGAKDFQVGMDNGGVGALNITGGGEMNHNWWINVARGAGSTGSVLVDGAGSTLTTSAGRIVTGEDGTGTLTVSNGGVVNHNSGDRFMIGKNTGATGTVVVDGVGSAINKNQGEVWVGGDDDSADAGVGILDVKNNATFTHLSPNAFIIGANGGRGTVNVSSGATLTRDTGGATSGDLILGIGGGGSSGTLNVSSGGKVNNNWWTVISDNESATATVNVDGAGSQINIAQTDQRFVVGRAGSGFLNLSNGGEVNVTNAEMHVGMWGAAQGKVTVESGGKINGQTNAANTDPGARGGVRFIMGTDAATTGRLDLNEGTVSVLSATIGNNGNAIVNQTGGTFNSNQWTEIGQDRDAGAHTPVYNISGGVLNTQSLSIGQRRNGAMNMTGGTVNVGNNGTVQVNYWGGFAIGNAGPTEDGGSHGNGLFNMSGGTLNLSEEANIGNQGGAIGVWDLSGGTVNYTVGDRRIHVGRRGNGTMNITGGVINGLQGFNVGAEAAPAGNPATKGVLTINMPNATDVIRAGDLYIGFGNRPTSGQTEGTVDVTKGTLRVDGWTEIGRGGAADGATSGGKGTLNITGPDAIFEHSLGGTSDVVVGYQGGQGAINVTGGGKMNHNWWLKLGSEGGTGTLNVRDSGSVVNLLDGNLVVGENNGGVGILNVTDGAVINHDNMGGPALDVNQYRLMIGEGAGTTGTMLIDGIGSKVNLAPKNGASNWTRIAANGTGTLTVRSGGEFNVAAQVNGTNGFLNGDQNVLLAEGAAAVGTLNIEDGGKVNIQSNLFGTSWTDAAGPGSQAAKATINISGVGSELNLISDGIGDEPDFILARRGTTTVNQSGGKATINGWFVIGHENGGSASYNQTGGVVDANHADSSIVIGRQTINGGYAGTAASSLNISESAVFNHNPGNGDPQGNNMVVGFETGGRGILSVTNGGTLNTTQEIRLGQVADSEGTMTVDDGTIASTAILSVGRGAGAKGTFNFNAGNVTYNQWMTVGHDGGTGTMNMTGGTLASASGGAAGEFLVGVDDNGSPIVTQGTLNHSSGTISSDNIVLGRNTNGGSTANLSGDGVMNFGQLRFGQGGNANSSATITDTYALNGRNAIDKGYVNIGESNGTGAVDVNMDGGVLNFNAWMDIGIGSGSTDPSKSVFVVNGGIVNGIGTGQVQPAGIAVGSDHGGTLELNDDGVINVASMSVGTFGDRGSGTAGNGLLLVFGGTANVTGDLTIGANFNGGGMVANGEMNMSGGLCNLGGNLAIARNANTTGKLLHSGGTLQVAGAFAMGNGVNTPLFSTTGNLNIAGTPISEEVTVGTTATISGGTANIDGDLLVNTAGTLTVTGDLNVNSGVPNGSATAGNVNVKGGLASINGTANITGNINVGATGTLSGSGFITTAQMTVQGTLSPGNSPGVLDVNGTIAFGSSSIYMVEFQGALPGEGAGFYDQTNMVNAAGSVILDAGNATGLNVSLLGGYTPVVGEIYYILNRADTASFANYFSGLPEGAFLSLGAGFGQITYQANWTGTQAGSTPAGGNDVAITVVPIPEPTSVLALVSVLGLGVLRRRR
jgi:T5SS/PEP-CTERM-associated repeat protein